MDDPMVLIHTDESKLNIKGAEGEQNSQMILDSELQRILTFQKVYGLSRYKEDSLLRYYGFGSEQEVYCGGGVSASKWCQLAKVRAGAPGHPSIPMNLTDA